MSLPLTFHFSQNNLQDYLDCPRRFELRHLLRLEWPALQTEPILEHEQQMLLGQRFHQMVQQNIAGLEAGLLSEQAASDPTLARWWENFLSSGILDELPPLRFAERQLSAPFLSYRLLAQYDLIAIQPGQRAVILDWKTGSAQGKPSLARLKNRMQTRLYPFLLCLAGAHLNGGSIPRAKQTISPQQVEMVYWFSEHPLKVIRFAYSAAQYDSDLAFLSNLVQEIEQQTQSSQISKFMLTPDERKCAYCNFRSLCQRGAQAGAWQDLPEDLEAPEDASLSLDFENLDPISF